MVAKGVRWPALLARSVTPTDAMGSQGTIRGASLGQWEVLVSQKEQPSCMC